jgi:energy-coupling factor transport system ATP-binding protein
MTPVIEVDRLCFTHAFSEKPVIDGLTFSAEPGSITALIGESGCGKTTFLMALLGLIPEFVRGQGSGRIRIAGTERPREFRRHIAPVFQNPAAQLTCLKVREELVANLHSGEAGPARGNWEAAPELDGFALGHLVDRRIDSLSWGEKQRVALACALARRPDILLLDEPLSGLDPVRRIECLDRLKEANRTRGTTILIVEHEIDLMRHFADRVLLFSNGRLEHLSETPTPVDSAVHASSVEPNTAGPVIEADSIRHTYSRSLWALRGVSGEVRRGECVAILGPNGAGKSTLGRCLARLTLPTVGEMRVCGRDVRRASRKEIARVVGVTFQDPDRQLFCQSVRDECLFASRNFDVPPADADQSLASLARDLEIGGLMHRAPLTLSHGEKKRVALAAALVHGPEVLLLDEPAAGLDQWNRRRVLRVLNKARQAGVGMMLITHDLALVNQLATRVMFLREGQKTFDDSTEAFFHADWEALYGS